MPFQLQKANMAALRKLSVGDRVAMARDEQFGPFLLSLMSPTDVALMFPRYYRDVLPNISGFQKAFPTSMSVAKQEAGEEQLRNTTSGSSAGANYNAGGWRKRWQENMDEQVASKSATPTKAGVRPPPQLTPGQKESFDALKQGPLAVDDPRAKMYANLTEEQLSAVGISKVKEGGKEVFKYAAPTVSDEEVKKSRARSLVSLFLDGLTQRHETTHRSGGKYCTRSLGAGNSLATRRCAAVSLASTLGIVFCVTQR
jgi:hypothetical protein